MDVVTPEVANLPHGWENRLKLLRVGKVRLHCLELHDLIVSKLAAGRLKDLEFAGALFRLQIAEARMVQRRIRLLPLAGERLRLRNRLKAVLEDLK